jgi:hypothetical protein
MFDRRDKTDVTLAKRSAPSAGFVALGPGTAGAIHHAHDALEIRDPDFQFFFSTHLPYTAPLYAYPRFCEMLVRNGRGEWLHD